MIIMTSITNIVVDVIIILSIYSLELSFTEKSQKPIDMFP